MDSSAEGPTKLVESRRPCADGYACVIQDLPSAPAASGLCAGPPSVGRPRLPRLGALRRMGEAYAFLLYRSMIVVGSHILGGWASLIMAGA